MAEPGTWMGGYRLESLLGRGGMAEVWLARNEKDELVALKRTPDSSASEAHEALALEARAGQRLSHPGIVRCLDFGQDASGPYLVLEYVDGPSLRERLASGPLPEEEAVAIGTAVLGALAAAHARGLVHNDLKPENILLGPDGPKVTDFGAAQSLTETLSLGRVEELTATIAYLAPEVLQGASPSAASDIYSLGLTLYEAVAGQLPFTGTPAIAAGQRITGGMPPLRRYAPAASPKLERTLARALEPDPALRYPDAAAFAAHLSTPSEQTVVINRPAAIATVPSTSSEDAGLTDSHTPLHERRASSSSTAGCWNSGRRGDRKHSGRCARV